MATSTHTSRGNIVPAHTQIPIDKAPQKSLPKKDLPSAITVSIAASANIAAEPHGAHSAFYLIRSGGFDRELSVTLQISGTAPSRSEHMTITTFVTFLPGETERFVAIQPILQDLFAPRQQLFLRVVPGAKYSTDATTATVKI